MRTARLLLTLALLASPAFAPAAILADDPNASFDDDPWFVAFKDYMACAADYATTAPTPTLAAAQSTCAKKLDAIGKAIYAKTLKEKLDEGATQEEAKTLAAKDEAEERTSALHSFELTYQTGVIMRN
jgi:hypothetical protein